MKESVYVMKLMSTYGDNEMADHQEKRDDSTRMIRVTPSTVNLITQQSTQITSDTSILTKIIINDGTLFHILRIPG